MTELTKLLDIDVPPLSDDLHVISHSTNETPVSFSSASVSLSSIGGASGGSASVTVASSMPVSTDTHNDPLKKNTQLTKLLQSPPRTGVSAQVSQPGSVLGKAVAVSSGMQQNQLQGGVTNSSLANISRSFTNSPVPNSIAKQAGGQGLSPSPTMKQTVGATSGIANTRTNNASGANTMGQFNPSTGAMPINSMGNANVVSNMGPGHGMMGNRPNMMNGPFQGGDGGMAMGMNNSMVRNNNPVANSIALQQMANNNAMGNSAVVNVGQPNMIPGMDPAMAKARGVAKVSIQKIKINSMR